VALPGESQRHGQWRIRWGISGHVPRAPSLKGPDIFVQNNFVPRALHGLNPPMDMAPIKFSFSLEAFGFVIVLPAFARQIAQLAPPNIFSGNV